VKTVVNIHHDQSANIPGLVERRLLSGLIKHSVQPATKQGAKPREGTIYSTAADNTKASTAASPEPQAIDANTHCTRSQKDHQQLNMLVTPRVPSLAMDNTCSN
jgi:hypothetical protein